MAIVLKDIHMTLDPASIQQAIDEIRDFEERLKPAMQCLLDYLGEKGVEIARAELIFFGISEDAPLNPIYQTGALSESIKYESTDDKVIISAGEGLTNAMGEPTNYAIYIEFGNNSKYPDGFWYPAPYGWWTPKKGRYAGQPMAFTPGYGPRPFMQNTMNDLREEIEASGGRIIAEYIRGERA